MRESERKDRANVLTALSVASGAFVLVVAIYGALKLGEWDALYKWVILTLLMLWPLTARFSWSEGGKRLLFQVIWAGLFSLALMVVFGSGTLGTSLAVGALLAFVVGRFAFHNRGARSV